MCSDAMGLTPGASSFSVISHILAFPGKASNSGDWRHDLRRIGHRREYRLTADDEDGVGLEFEAESPDHPAQFFNRAQGLPVRHITGAAEPEAPSVPVPPPVSPPDRCE